MSIVFAYALLVAAGAVAFFTLGAVIGLSKVALQGWRAATGSRLARGD